MPQLNPAIVSRNVMISPMPASAAAAAMILMLSLLLSALPARAARRPAVVSVTGVARPWRDVQLSFSRAGRIDKIFGLLAVVCECRGRLRA